MNKRDLGGRILASVSRSFYLSIRVLPAAIREPIGLGYLLARISDTIADSPGVPVSVRLHALDAFGRSVQLGNGFVVPRELSPDNEAEKKLLKHAGDALHWLTAISSPDRKDIRELLQSILKGQRADLTRHWPVRDSAELEEYTYLVAGCVGEFWTRICVRHLRRYSRLPAREMERLGVEFGKGLQLVNILRDLPEDIRNGRCYLPGDPAQAQRVWREKAAEYVKTAFRYTEAVRPWRVRLACILPAALAQITLRLLESHDLSKEQIRIKVPRREVKRLIWRALPAAFSNRSLSRLRKSL